MKNLRLLFVALATALCCAAGFSQNFYAMDTVQKIEIQFAQSNWDYILDTAKQGSDGYTMAAWVKINGVMFDSAGVKYKGNSSYNPMNAKNPLHIELDHFKEQDYLGFKDIKLSNGYHEPSSVREVLLYSMAQNYMKASRANFAEVKINGQLWGLYTNTEAVTNTLLEDRFYSDNGSFVFADNGGCDLLYKGSDTMLYTTPYTIKSDFGLERLKDLCDTLNNHFPEIEEILDVDRALWMLAYTNSMVILDSYLGNAKHNYYLYEDGNGRFNPIIWDLNGGMGVFSRPGPGNTQWTTAQMQNMSPLLHSADIPWPLAKNLLSDPMYKRMYIAHMKTIVEENLDNSSYHTHALQLQGIVDTLVQADPNAFYTYQEFLDNMTTTVIDGPKIIPGITELMDPRRNFLNGTPEFQAVAPTISNIQPSNTFPALNTPVFITATVSNSNAVYLGIRAAVVDRFNRMPMYDDGLHGDGAANDGQFGATVTITDPQLQYYVYAENNNAGLFAPRRAEHEYYVLDANYGILQAGDVVINEIMAMNTTTVANASGNYADWVELHNTTSNPVSLDYLNLSDQPTNPTKWQFPSGITIPAYGYQIIWADEENDPTELHSNFKLSGSGEQVVISYANGTVIDSMSFPAQSADISWARNPNGTGPFGALAPTFNANNTPTQIAEPMDLSGDAHVFPNPTEGEFTVSLDQGTISELKIMDIVGHTVLHLQPNAQQVEIRLDQASGLYFYQIRDRRLGVATGKIVLRHR